MEPEYAAGYSKSLSSKAAAGETEQTEVEVKKGCEFTQP